jgi:hypothetical protein
MRGLRLDDVAGHQPAEQHAQRGENCFTVGGVS